MSWTSYFQDTDAVILVVDSTDRMRTALVKLELQRLLECDSLRGACILVFANKQDLRDAMGVAELTAVLGLQSVRSHEWHVQPACALTGEGLHDGLAWVVQRVTKGLSTVAPEAAAPPPEPPFPLPPAPPPPPAQK
jgi:signal recognition particle receptor subunit beta